MAITVDVLTGGSNNHETTSEAANAIATDFIAEGIVSTVSNTSGVAPATGGFAVNAQGTPDMTVAVSAGVAYVQGTPTSQNSQTFRVKNSASSNVTIAANSSGSTKYDWVYISLNATNLNTPNTAGDNVATLTTSRSSSASTDDGTPPTYGYPLAVVTVANGASSITNSMIRDVRVQAAVSAGASSTSSTWTDTGYVPGTVTYNGNRSFQAVVSGADLTSFLSTGMRLKLTRTTAPPTQCTDLESGSSQYWSKSSPSGISFTDTPTFMAWVKLESYTGSDQIIISRKATGTAAGWEFKINSSGQVVVRAGNTAANLDDVTSYQSIPLGKWVHVCGQITMSTSGSSFIYIDGVSVPTSFTNGTSTTITQAGNLNVGATNTPDAYFDGKIAQVAVFTSILSAATIRSYASQTLAGSESTCVGLWKFNGDGNDSSSNANNLTAQGGATATTVDSPFNSTEYGVITKIAFSTDTTMTVQVPEGYAIPTSTGGLSAMAYSTAANPLNFPSDRGKWRISSILRTQTAVTSNATYNTFASNGWAISVPIGAFNVGAYLPMYSATTTTVAFNLSNTTSIIGVATGSEDLAWTARVQSAAASTSYNNAIVENYQVLTAATTYIIYTAGATTSAGIVPIKAELYADFNYV